VDFLGFGPLTALRGKQPAHAAVALFASGPMAMSLTVLIRHGCREPNGVQPARVVAALTALEAMRAEVKCSADTGAWSPSNPYFAGKRRPSFSSTEGGINVR